MDSMGAESYRFFAIQFAVAIAAISRYTIAKRRPNLDVGVVSRISTFMQLQQILAALEKRGLGEVLLRGGEPMQTRSGGQWQAQGTPITAATLSAMIENAAPAQAIEQWRNSGQCQFEQNGFAVKAARREERVQVAIKRQIAATDAFDAPTSAFSPAPNTGAVAVAPVAQPLLQPAVVEWFYLDGSDEKGPLAPDRVRALISMGTIGAQTLVWSDGMAEWLPARDSDLRSMLPATALHPVPISPPVAPIASPYGNAGPGRIGGGRIHEIPPSHDKFSIGSFALPLFWCSSHNQSSRYWPIFLTRFIPFVGTLVSLYFNVQLASEANALAWASREWKSVEHFEKTQKVWTIVGSIFIGLYVCLIIFAVIGGLSER